MPTFPYLNGRKNLMLAGVNLETAPIKAALMAAAYTPNFDTHNVFSGISANEAAGTGYTAGGLTLTGKTVTTDAAADRAVFDAADATWNPITIQTAGAVVYDSASGILLAWFDFNGTKSPTQQLWSVIWDATGIIRL